jgi:hypothetical protein
MAGLPVSGADVNLQGGDISRQMQNVCNRAEEFKRFLDRYSAEQMVEAFAMTLEDATLMKSGYGELALVVETQTNNRTFSSQLAGMGDIS